MNSRLLIVDDDVEICVIFKEVAEKCGYSAAMAHSSEAFQQQLLHFDPTMIILDLHFTEGDGIETLHYLSTNAFNGEILLISGQDTRLLKAVVDIGTSLNLKMLGGLQKPVKLSFLTDMLKKQLSLEVDLSPAVINEAISNDQFQVHYQPKISLSQNQVSGVEALIRWNYKGRILIYPDSFIPHIEQTDLIVPITYWLLERVFRDLLALPESQKMSFAVNISAKLLEDIRFTDHILARKQDLKINPGNLTFEITETQAIELPTAAMDIVSRLRLRGFTVSIDDFGTGYSSLMGLYKMPFNELKIDKMFVKDLAQDNEAKKIVKSIIDLGHNLGLTIVAEGVEDLKSLHILKELKCDYAQGYLISKPLSYNELGRWLNNQEDQAWRKI